MPGAKRLAKESTVFITPYDLSVSLWQTMLPSYEWVPEPPPELPPAGGDVAADGACTVPAGTLPAMRLVFRGNQAVTFMVWSSRENLAWEQMAQGRRDDDEHRNTERSRQPARALRPAGPGAGAADAAATGDTPS